MKRIRVLALIYPIERHVGHWACSSPSIDVARVIMDADDNRPQVERALHDHKPHAIAIIGKRVNEYHDLLDDISHAYPELKAIPRIYRCQNTAFRNRIEDIERVDRETLSEMDAWYARACDPRFSLILVQTMDDVEVIRRTLYPTRVAACPFGYDKTIFEPDLPEIERTVDVGCYFNLRNDERRTQLIERAREICERRGWTFRFVSDRYWQDYAQQIRSTKVCLHRSDQQEVPYRMYEVTSLGALFLTDPLRYSVDSFFEKDKEYLTYNPDLSDLEETLDRVLNNEKKWQAIRHAGWKRAREYDWGQVAEKYVLPALRDILDW